MSNYQPMVIVAVVSLGIVAWTLLCAFIIGLVIELRRQKTADTETPSSVNCPVHGPACEGWL